MVKTGPEAAIPIFGADTVVGGFNVVIIPGERFGKKGFLSYQRSLSDWSKLHPHSQEILGSEPGKDKDQPGHFPSFLICSGIC